MSRSIVALLMLWIVGVAGCGRQASLPQPESLIRSVLLACQQAEYAEAARYFEGGPERLKSSPQWVRDFLDRISDKGNAVTFEVQDRLERGDTLQLQIITYRDEKKATPLRTSTWSFAKTKSGWIITKVE
jgi:hypothetical protein